MMALNINVVSFAYLKVTAWIAAGDEEFHLSGSFSVQVRDEQRNDRCARNGSLVDRSTVPLLCKDRRVVVGVDNIDDHSRCG